MFNIRKILRSSGLVTVLVAGALQIGQVVAPSELAAGPAPPGVNWGS